ncbi:MAG: UDP-N-acetylglucosamine 2-epimerase (non-hydrolyzing) [Syntrophales bacterium]|jgi:UDP-N-acetylglucosamine 2-epimerase (non-hydrolysing)|nr:UDP-N-acetylglucosamine 2-epimerase (non-hydrolyzing) [Syntrophales bacterium]MCK9528058.1 UDP-N-acetylglucosamine 2-epimerase (non-hydrolyzing) [Syntrophales bacterium]MDX9922346.1 UDP-N-acetylglucosamine 2-epimerase (non-hydrolyzing) [Syntrophales bacterium]
MKVLLVAGARPNFVKAAPVYRAAMASGRMDCRLVHTGQHYDYEMSHAFFEDLSIPKPRYFLGAGSGSHAVQTAKVMTSFEKVCIKEKPDIVIVVGDVNSTLACSVTAKKLLITVAHVEAGLRSGDRTMPEEINRIVTDSISDLLFVTEKDGIENLRREGHGETSIHFVGNVMIDTLYSQIKKLATADVSLEPGIREIMRAGPYGVVTLHRPSNVDERETFLEIMMALAEISEDMPLVFPVHPRTSKNVEEFGLTSLVGKSGIYMTAPLSYMPFLTLWKDASLVLTDSGGLQEETTALGVPCFTIRDNTERPVTVDEGTNTLVGTAGRGIQDAYLRFREGDIKKGRIPKFWDGNAAERIVNAILTCGL